MKIKSLFIFKLTLVFLIFIYIGLSEINSYTNKFDATLTLLFSIIFLFKSRKNPLVCLVAFFMFYCNYSIVMGEYIIGGNLGIPLYEVKNTHFYGLTIRILLLFISIITIFYNNKQLNLSEFKLIPKDNVVVFSGIYLILIYIVLFGIKRTELNSYGVSITPLYEYSNLLFLFAYYFSGTSKIRKSLFIILLSIFILQDFYYGGRITSLQLIFLFLLTVFIPRLSFKGILMYGLLGLFINSLVAAYRKDYSLEIADLFGIIPKLINGYFVFDTPVYAYYASATHVAATEIAEFNVRLSSFIEFIKSIVLGSNNVISNVTGYVSINYYQNIGGGIIPTHFYFWLGWLGVIVISIIFVLIFNRLAFPKSDFQKMFFIMVILTVPRWYLYSPLGLFRGSIFFLIILFVSFLSLNVITQKIAGKKHIN